MANLPEQPEYEEGIYQLEETDPVLGGPNGVDNLQAKQLANRTEWLRQELEELRSEFSGYVKLVNQRNKNSIINGNFDIWQRGISQTTTGYGSDDRWYNEHYGSSKTVSQQLFAVGQTEVPNNPRYFSRTVVSSVSGSSNHVFKSQKIEDVRTYAGETVTLSFWAKADSNKNIATSFVQKFGTGGSPSGSISGISPATHSLTTSWQKFIVTVDIPSIAGKTLGTHENSFLDVRFWFDSGSTFNSRTNSLGQQSGTFDIAQVQLEKGGLATDFENRSIGEELTLCQRFFEKSYNLEWPIGTLSISGAVLEDATRNATNRTVGCKFSVSKRATPAVVIYSYATGAPNKVGNNGDATVTSFVGLTQNAVTGLNLSGGNVSFAIAYHWTADAEL